jgi:hypothetical protein
MQAVKYITTLSNLAERLADKARNNNDNVKNTKPKISLTKYNRSIDDVCIQVWKLNEEFDFQKVTIHSIKAKSNAYCHKYSEHQAKISFFYLDKKGKLRKHTQKINLDSAVKTGAEQYYFTKDVQSTELKFNLNATKHRVAPKLIAHFSQKQYQTDCKTIAIAMADFILRHSSAYTAYPKLKSDNNLSWHTIVENLEVTEHVKNTSPNNNSSTKHNKRKISHQGELLSVDDFLLVAKKGGLKGEVIKLNNLEQFKQNIVNNIDQGIIHQSSGEKAKQCLAVFFAVDTEKRKSGRLLTSNNHTEQEKYELKEHVGIVTGYFDNVDDKGGTTLKVRVSHWGGEFWYDAQDLFNSCMNLKKQRKAEHYIKDQDKKAVLPYENISEQEIPSKVKAGIKVLSTHTPKPNSGFKGTMIAFSL